jgi:hypothetical protein
MKTKDPFEDDLLIQYRRHFAALGGKARAKSLTAKRRKAIAKKASRAAARVRSAKKGKR